MDYKRIGAIIGVMGLIFYTKLNRINKKINKDKIQRMIQKYDDKLHALETDTDTKRDIVETPQKEYLITNPKILNLTGKNIRLYTKDKLICKLPISGKKLSTNQKIKKEKHDFTFDLYSISSKSEVGKIPIKTKSPSTILYGFSDDLLYANVLVTKDVADFLFSDEGIERYQGKLNEVFILDDSTPEYDEMGIFLGYTHLIYYGSLQQM